MISLTDFAHRHFSETFSGTKVLWISPEAFESDVKELAVDLSPGYAPFCMHAFVPNVWCVKPGVARITPENQHLLQSEYVARREEELPVLVRHFPSGSVQTEEAVFLDLILYSADQLAKEGIEIDGDWGIVSINACMDAEEAPMGPTTMLRNALGIEQGGSGVALDREAYLASVEYWSQWATVK